MRVGSERLAGQLPQCLRRSLFNNRKPNPFVGQERTLILRIDVKQTAERFVVGIVMIKLHHFVTDAHVVIAVSKEQFFIHSPRFAMIRAIHQEARKGHFGPEESTRREKTVNIFSIGFGAVEPAFVLRGSFGSGNRFFQGALLFAPRTFLFSEDEQRVAAAFVDIEGLSGMIVPFRRLRFPGIIRGFLRTFEWRHGGRGGLHSRLEVCRRQECVGFVDVCEGLLADYALHLRHSPLGHARRWSD